MVGRSEAEELRLWQRPSRRRRKTDRGRRGGAGSIIGYVDDAVRRRRHRRQEMKIDFRGEAHAVVRIEGRTDR